jgi:hydroxyethylthiazole kinase-like uncharacterized protein yjeF
MSKPKKALYLTEHLRTFEKNALKYLGIPENELMQSAGTFAFSMLKKLYPDVKVVAVFCGGGNNAGDGYVLAGLLNTQGYTVIVYQFQSLDHLPAVARSVAEKVMNEGVPSQMFPDSIDSDVELVIDALLGIGLQGAVYGPIAHAINLINDSELPVMALDVPSGLDADTGKVMGGCVRADVTITFIGRKVGLMILDGPDYAGKVVCSSLQLDSLCRDIKPAAYQIGEHVMSDTIAPRLKNSHKGLFGHVLVIGGGKGMPGAAVLAALAACRVGAGLVSIATLPEHVMGSLPGLPEVMVHGIDSVDDLMPLLAKATVVVIGPGLGEGSWAKSLFLAAIKAQLPLVIDASALRMLALYPQYDDTWVLTPHPGEAATLLGTSVDSIQNDRLSAASKIQKQYGGSVVLKGVGSIVADTLGGISVCAAGNPGMASAGMGDVLSGIIGGLLAQGVLLSDAAELGVWLHATAADDAVSNQGERGLLASDLMPYLRRQINQCT